MAIRIQQKDISARLGRRAKPVVSADAKVAEAQQMQGVIAAASGAINLAGLVAQEKAKKNKVQAEIDRRYNKAANTIASGNMENFHNKYKNETSRMMLEANNEEERAKIRQERADGYVAAFQGKYDEERKGLKDPMEFDMWAAVNGPEAKIAMDKEIVSLQMAEKKEQLDIHIEKLIETDPREAAKALLHNTDMYTPEQKKAKMARIDKAIIQQKENQTFSLITGLAKDKNSALSALENVDSNVDKKALKTRIDHHYDLIEAKKEDIYRDQLGFVQKGFNEILADPNQDLDPGYVDSQMANLIAVSDPKHQDDLRVVRNNYLEASKASLERGQKKKWDAYSVEELFDGAKKIYNDFDAANFESQITLLTATDKIDPDDAAAARKIATAYKSAYKGKFSEVESDVYSTTTAKMLDKTKFLAIEALKPEFDYFKAMDKYLKMAELYRWVGMESKKDMYKLIPSEPTPESIESAGDEAVRIWNRKPESQLMSEYEDFLTGRHK